MVNEVYKIQKSCECIFPIENVVYLGLSKTFYHISVNFRNPGFCLVSKPRKLVFIFRTGPTTIVSLHCHIENPSIMDPYLFWVHQ